MQPLDKNFASSVDACALSMDKLREIFPACFLEGSGDHGPRFRIDFDALKEALGRMSRMAKSDTASPGLARPSRVGLHSPHRLAHSDHGQVSPSVGKPPRTCL